MEKWYLRKAVEIWRFVVFQAVTDSLLYNVMECITAYKKEESQLGLCKAQTTLLKPYTDTVSDKEGELNGMVKNFLNGDMDLY